MPEHLLLTALKSVKYCEDSSSKARIAFRLWKLSNCYLNAVLKVFSIEISRLLNHAIGNHSRESTGYFKTM